MRRLPATIEELAGRRAARWIRESTPGQFDRYGPEAQAELQDRAIAKLGLVDSGLAWRAAHSGRTVYRSAEMADMLGAAQRGDFEVLLVGYVSRWQRNLRRTLELLEDTLHPAGVPVYFCDEEILSSSERHWDQLVDEAKDAERYSRRLSRRIKEGYASKLVKERDPGGHPPFGFLRNGDKLLEPDPERLPVGASGVRVRGSRPDRSRCRDGGRPAALHRPRRSSPRRCTSAGSATASRHAGRRLSHPRSGRPPRRPGPGEPRRRAVRPIRADRTPSTCSTAPPVASGSPATRATTATGTSAPRSSTPDLLAAALAAMYGHAYRREMYEQIVEALLAEASIGAGAIAGVVSEVAGADRGRDDATSERIDRERERAMARYLRDRDAEALEQTMSQTRPRAGRSRDGAIDGGHPGRCRGEVRPVAPRDVAQGRRRLRAGSSSRAPSSTGSTFSGCAKPPST